ncbi:MAG TPA: hypothetical protein VNW92_12830 [Polyangiaceae bacterium]|nr:hypothetical protein [Polyangiaceae bacterium]
MRQESLTVVARVDEAQQLSDVRAALRALAQDSGPECAIKPRVFTDPKLGIHFARLVLLEEPSGSPYGSSLVFESNFDTELAESAAARSAHLSSLCETIQAQLLGVFQYCSGFSGRLSSSELAARLEQHLVESTACYQGHTERDLGRIRLEQHLREVLLSYFERAPKAPPRELYLAAREYVRLRAATDPQLAGLEIDNPAPPFPDAKIRSQRLSAGLAVWFENISLRLAVYIVSQLHNLWRWTQKDPQFEPLARQEAWTELDRRAFLEVAASEDHGLQNALTHIVPLKNADRLRVLRAAHGYIDRMAKNQFDDIGQLGGIPTIHFAKWLLVDEGKRLLFLSNYDSSWESYLGDFVDRAAIGLNLAWTWTDLYPKTVFFNWGGANDEERFKAWSRAHQRPTQVFYSAYPELGIAALNNNTWIRCGLHHPPCAMDLPGWFRRLT